MTSGCQYLSARSSKKVTPGSLRSSMVKEGGGLEGLRRMGEPNLEVKLMGVGGNPAVKAADLYPGRWRLGRTGTAEAPVL